MNNLAQRKKQLNLSNYFKETDYIEIDLSADHYEGAFLFSAIGDALGWPTEFLGSINKSKLPFKLPLKEYIQWKKNVGGRWWGYYDEIKPGEYSDDTQLTLAISRCISNSGDFEPDRFAYSELPLWLQYQRGGGRSVKTAARTILRRKSEWCNNFYSFKERDYRNAGANGAAMRNLPIILANVNDEHRMITDSFYNSIITHGHPRAILGTILFSYAVRYALSSEDNMEKGMIEYLLNSLKTSLVISEKDPTIQTWIRKWNAASKLNDSFTSLFQETIGEIYTYLCQIPYYLDKPENEYYSLIGALNPSTKGSGVATVCCAIYLFLKNGASPEEALFSAINILGSDTDTIAVFLGSLLGARYGRGAIPSHFITQLQDHEYIEKTALRLHSISQDTFNESISQSEQISKKEGYLRILAWEIGLQEMFWDAIGVGGIVAHPALGRGTIIHKEIKQIRRKDYEAKLLQVKFDCGQTCIFHSRVQQNGYISESLGKDVMRQLNGFK